MHMKAFKTALCILFGLACLMSCKPQKADIRVSEGHFVIGDEPQYFIGANAWYASRLAVEQPERLIAELDSLHARGIDNLRILATDENWEGMDLVLSEMQKRNMRAVLFLNNAWEWSPDGYRSYLEAAGAGPQPHPVKDGYTAYMNGMKEFAKNDQAVKLFQDHVRRIVTRYKDSDAIFSWQVCNEPRPFSKEQDAVDAFVKYVQQTASLIKSIDHRHMVSTGNEGGIGCNDGDYELCERLNDCPDIDYITVHIWPYNWSWISADRVVDGLEEAIDRTDDYITAHIEMGRKLGKPVVIEEFGYPRNGFVFDNTKPTSGRDIYYEYIFSRILSSARTGDVLAGCNFWAWSGLAKQTPGHDFWEEGDDLAGDPFQEAQGLNGVYLSDRSTVSVITAYADSLRKAATVIGPAPETWLYTGEGPFTLDAKVSGVEVTEVSFQAVRDIDMMDPAAKPVLSLKETVRPEPGKTTTVSFPLGSLGPGFYRITLDGRQTFNIGINPEKIESPADSRADFDRFWEETLGELAKIPMVPQLTPVPEHSDSSRTCYHVRIPSFGGGTMGGILYLPVKEGRYPVRLEYMGYGAEIYYRDPSSDPGRIDFLVSVRDQGIFKDEKAYWIDRGLSSKESFYYRGAYCDAVRALDYVRTLDKADPERILISGESQGGALAFVAASLGKGAKALAVSVPFMGDFPDYGKIVWWPVHEILQYAAEEGLSRDSVMEMLSYFDTKNFAGRISCPVLMAFGLQDPVCPPHTNFAAYNQIKSEKKYLCVSTCGHGMWAEPEWNKVREEFFNQY